MRGHDMSEGSKNIYFAPNGKRQCRACNRHRQHLRNVKRSEKMGYTLRGRRPAEWYVAPEGMKRCGTCEETKPVAEFHKARANPSGLQGRCKPCGIAAAEAWVAKNGGSRAMNLLRKYGITLDDYEALFAEQNGRCAICLVTPENERFGMLSVDHNHETGEVRGLLCRHCNFAIGLLNDNHERAERLVGYLTKEIIHHA